MEPSGHRRGTRCLCGPTWASAGGTANSPGPQPVSDEAVPLQPHFVCVEASGEPVGTRAGGVFEARPGVALGSPRPPELLWTQLLGSPPCWPPLGGFLELTEGACLACGSHGARPHGVSRCRRTRSVFMRACMLAHKLIR